MVVINKFSTQHMGTFILQRLETCIKLAQLMHHRNSATTFFVSQPEHSSYRVSHYLLCVSASVSSVAN